MSVSFTVSGVRLRYKKKRRKVLRARVRELVGIKTQSGWRKERECVHCVCVCTCVCLYVRCVCVYVVCVYIYMCVCVCGCMYVCLLRHAWSVCVWVTCMQSRVCKCMMSRRHNGGIHTRDFLGVDLSVLRPPRPPRVFGVNGTCSSLQDEQQFPIPQPATSKTKRGGQQTSNLGPKLKAHQNQNVHIRTCNVFRKSFVVWETTSWGERWAI